MDASGELHPTRVNGWRLKPYFSQVLEEQVDTTQVNFVSKEPLGVSAQDPSLAQHVPCTDIINIGPITRPCIDTILCNQAQLVAILSLVERMSAQAGYREITELTPLKDWSKRHECLLRLGEG